MVGDVLVCREYKKPAPHPDTPTTAQVLADLRAREKRKRRDSGSSYASADEEVVKSATTQTANTTNAVVNGEPWPKRM